MSNRIAKAANWVFDFWWRNRVGRIIALLAGLVFMGFAVASQNPAVITATGVFFAGVIQFYKWAQGKSGGDQ